MCRRLYFLSRRLSWTIILARRQARKARTSRQPGWVEGRSGEAPAPQQVGMGASPIPGRYFFFATTLVTRLPIAGDFISTVSPGFRKRSGAEVLSGKSALESAAVPAAVPPLMISPG